MTPPRKRRLLTIAHSYVVEVNRRLADELAANGDWDVTAVAPARLRGDFGWHTLEPRANERCEVIPVPVRLPRSVHLMTYGSALSSLLRQPWDLVHCWEEPYVLCAAQIARATPPNVPLVFATFQNIAKRYPPPFNWIERYTLSRASGVIAFGRTVYDVAATRLPRDIPMRVISPGVDLTQFKPDPVARATIRQESGWAEHEAVVGFVGRFVEAKGIRVLTAALDRVRAPWRALFIGGGPLEGELTEWARPHGHRVRIVRSAHTDVAWYLNAMDLLCAPSQTTPRWREQFGRMLIEAFACGVPVIASDSGEIPYVVGDAGVIVGEHDRDGWTRAIEDLLADPVKRESLAARGRQRAARMFSLPAVARQHLDFFDELVGQPAMRASAR